ncbi:MAG: hypothetical protein U0354_12550 [Candidatus Sericytochromatia bacterium]
MYFQYKKISKLLVVALLSINLPVMASKLYTDIPAGHWAETAADVLGEENIMLGASVNEFGGNLTINRYEVARIINGLLGKRFVPGGIILLSDVRAGHPDFTNIMRVLNSNLMDTSNNKFNGDKKVTRYEFANFMIKTLDYLQADPISIRQPPKAIGNIEAERRELLNKAVNYWQLTEGYTSWDQNINRYGALEMTAKAAININPDLLIRIGNINKQSPNETPPSPVKTPEPIRPTPYPTPEQTPVIVQTPEPVTPTPIPVRTPEPIKPSPIIIEPTIAPTPVPIVTPEPTQTPIPIRTPVISIPTPEVSTPPNVLPTPVVTTVPVNTNPNTSSTSGSNILRSQFTFRALYNFMYSESIPSFPTTLEPVRSHDDALGLAVNADLSYWFKDFDVAFVKDMGITASINSLGSYSFPKETQTVKPDTLINETFKLNIAVLYKLLKTQDIEFAAGLEGFIRNTSRDSQKTVDSYWRASKSYLGVGAKALLGWRAMDKLVIETALGAHYVPQTINEKVVYPNTQPSTGQDANTIDRFGFELGINGRYDIIQFGSNWLYGDIALNSRFLLGDGSQTIIGGGGGIGISF